MAVIRPSHWAASNRLQFSLRSIFHLIKRTTGWRWRKGIPTMSTSQLNIGMHVITLTLLALEYVLGAIPKWPPLPTLLAVCLTGGLVGIGISL
jgi:hypothetical protein